MKKLIYIGIVIFLGLSFEPGYGQTSVSSEKASSRDHLSLFFNVHPDQDLISQELIEDELNEFCTELLIKRSKFTSARDYISYIFFKVHKKYLYSYLINSPTYKTFATGEYDCLSGTAIYGMVFTKLGIKYTIRETPFHIYMMVYDGENEYLIESTDPENGFLSDKEEIRQREALYAHAPVESEYYKFEFTIDEKIQLTELAGLEYYNQGVLAYNDRKFEESFTNFEKALALYPSERIKQVLLFSLEMAYKENTLESERFNALMNKHGK